MGAIGKYQEWITKEGLIKIEGWAKDGLTDKQIAHNMGITQQTLNKWKKKYSSLFESLKRGKEVVDREVENALYKRALGYEYEEKIFEGDELKRVVKKQMPPDPTSMIFWLKNRKPTEWRDKHEVDNNIKTNGFKIIIDGEELSDD